MIKKYGDGSDFIIVDECKFFNIEGRNITKRTLKDAWMVITTYLGCYPPNIVEVRGKRVWFYHGLEEGLMSWDSIDKRKLKKLIRKFTRWNNGK